MDPEVRSLAYEVRKDGGYYKGTRGREQFRHEQVPAAEDIPVGDFHLSLSVWKTKLWLDY